MKFRVRTLVVAVLLAGVIGSGESLAKPKSIGPNVPTKPNYGIAFNKGTSLNLLFRRGMLSCTSAATTDCAITNMPLIAQGGPGGDALRDALASYVQKYVVKSGPDAGKVIWAEPQFADVGTVALSPTDFAERILGNGCYITSVTTAVNAVLANTTATRTSRTLQFEAIAANSLYQGSKPYNQLLWQYERWADVLQPNKVDPTQPGPGPAFLELPELASDLTPAGVFASPELDSVSDAAIIDAMKHDKITIISYQRYRPTAVFSALTKTYTVTLVNFGQHKVAVSGFQPGAFPVAIHDVGDGQGRRVHVARALSNFKWSFKGTGARPMPIAVTSIKWDPKVANQPMLIYEGEDSITLNDPKEQIIVIDWTEEIRLPNITGIKPLPCGPKSKPCIEEQKVGKPPLPRPPEPGPAPIVKPH